ncbi:MAG: hypothetical protein P1U42_11065 [Phycisphaerales bacterium]|nr:hypothetical protein [Phycisphaerales bacterium]
MDRINSSSLNSGSFPINAALRAYSQSPRVQKPGGSPFVNSVQPLRPTAATTVVEPSQRASQLDTAGKITPRRSALESQTIDQLVGAKVQPIDLSNDVAKVVGPKPMTTSAGTYTMYPQAVERNQVATNVAVGRSLDLRG